MKEIFKNVENYDENYQASSLGRVKSLCFGRERVLKSNVSSSGYLIVSLYIGGKGKTHQIHRLVAEAFLEKPEGINMVVDHINNDQLDNRLENLQWIEQRENCSKYKKNGSSQYIWVCWHKRYSKWQARIKIN